MCNKTFDPTIDIAYLPTADWKQQACVKEITRHAKNKQFLHINTKNRQGNTCGMATQGNAKIENLIKNRTSGKWCS